MFFTKNTTNKQSTNLRKNCYLCKSLNHLNMKYPIGIQTFSQIRENGFVYVDITFAISTNLENLYTYSRFSKI